MIFSSNKVQFITPSIRKSKNLKVLKLNSNCLNVLPNEIGELIFLEELDISDNKLYGIPDTVA
jgi:Leucine-rich repeat (LRR) protein